MFHLSPWCVLSLLLLCGTPVNKCNGGYYRVFPLKSESELGNGERKLGCFLYKGFMFLEFNQLIGVGGELLSLLKGG